MEARLVRLSTLLALALCTPHVAQAASYRTRNFLVTAASPQLAKKVGDAAETYRRDLAVEWLGEALPDWQDICPVTVVLETGASGQTSFRFRGGQPYEWTMVVRGPEERVMDSVLPHEVTHTIFATHFGRPLPRWADEGACTTVEHSSEKSKQEHSLIGYLQKERGIPFNQMFAMRDYPRDILPLYAQGYSLVRFLLSLGGKQKFVKYVEDGLKTSNWTASTKKHYGITSLSELQVSWLEWVRAGSQEHNAVAMIPEHARNHLAGGQLASNTSVGTAANPAGRELVPVQNVALERTTEDSGVGRRSSTPPRTMPDALADASGSWYARQRDKARANRPADDGAVVSSSPLNAVPGDAPYRAVRPQPPVQPGQKILEWSRPAPGTSAAPIRLQPLASPALPTPKVRR